MFSAIVELTQQIKQPKNEPDPDQTEPLPGARTWIGSLPQDDCVRASRALKMRALGLVGRGVQARPKPLSKSPVPFRGVDHATAPVRTAKSRSG